MVKLTFAVPFLILLLITAIQVNACTAFSVHSQKVYFGKNWDFDSSRHDVAFTMIKDSTDPITILEIRLKNGNGYLCTSVNNKGLFITTNHVSDIVEVTDTAEFSGKIMLRMLHETYSSAASIGPIVDSARAHGTFCPGYPEHILAADARGKASIIETNNISTFIINDSSGILTMTNVPNRARAYWINDTRLMTAKSYIEEHAVSFTVSDAFEVLKRTAQSNATPTQYSLVCDPQEQIVYMCLNRDFTRLWKISFVDKSLSTYSGFSLTKKLSFNDGRILMDSLVLFQEQDSLESARLTFHNSRNEHSVNTIICKQFDGYIEFSFRSPINGTDIFTVKTLDGKLIRKLQINCKFQGIAKFRWDRKDLSGCRVSQKACIGEFRSKDRRESFLFIVEYDR